MEITVSRRVYRVFHWLAFALPMAGGAFILRIGEGELFAWAGGLCLLISVLAGLDFVRAWRDSEEPTPQQVR